MITLFALLSGTASAQEFAVKSNLLYDATSTINLGVEYGLSPRWTLEVSGNYNAWTFSDNKKMKLWMLQPFRRTFLGSPLAWRRIQLRRYASFRHKALRVGIGQ